ncbi:MAG: rhodanese-like domain-containing protein [Chitinophagaceae bacterium]|nr:rhodanese-like domain-containing protein [Chitinophagaceae bacterium]
MKLLLSVLLLATLLPACQSQNSGSKTNLSPDEFEKGMTQPNVQILDVRTAGEFRNGHLKNALQADWRDKNQFKDRTQHLDKTNQSISIVYLEEEVPPLQNGYAARDIKRC